MLTKRQSQILDVIVDEHVHTAQPVSSGTVFGKGVLGVSCPTIRNEMAALTDMGYLAQPYTSAGRVPTEKGYRLFVDVLVKRHRPTHPETETQERERSSREGIRDRARGISSRTSDLVVFVDSDDGEVKYIGLTKVFRNPEFNTHASVISMLEELERFENYVDELERHVDERLEVFIGSENPFFVNPQYSMISSRVHDSFIALLGPMRMNYRNNLTLLDSLLEQ